MFPVLEDPALINIWYTRKLESKFEIDELFTFFDSNGGGAKGGEEPYLSP